MIPSVTDSIVQLKIKKKAQDDCYSLAIRLKLHAASVSDSLGFHSQVCLFLKRGASQTEVDEQGHDPLSIAVQTANADIVTL